MLKENQKIKIKWNNHSKQHYIDLGYRYTKCRDEFIVNAEDLSHGSKAKVIVVCDYCGKEIEVAYKDYLRRHDNKLGDCCFDCCQIKREASNLKNFGVRNLAQSKEIMDKIQSTNLQKYGNICSAQGEEVKEKIKQTNRNKYGYDWSAQSPKVIAKIRQSLYQNGSTPTSKMELYICQMLVDIYGKENCYPSYPFNQITMDCLLTINDCKIDVEYDGWYWHKNKQEADRRRNYYLFKNGYKVLRIKSNYQLPTEEQLQNAIDYLVKDNHSYAEILLDI